MINSTYDEVYGRWRAAPESFWAEVAEGNSLVQKMGQDSRCFAPSVLPLVHRRDGEHLL